MNSRKLFRTFISAILILPISAAVALGQNTPTADRLLASNGEDPPGSFSAMAVDQSQCTGCCDAGCCQPCFCPRWTASAEFICFDRVGGVNQTLVSTYPPHSPLILGTGTERLNSNDLVQGFSGGPRLDLIHHDDGGCDLELSYFQIDGWSSAKSVEPNYTGGRAAAQLAGVHGSRQLRPNDRLSRPGHGMDVCDETL